MAIKARVLRLRLIQAPALLNLRRALVTARLLLLLKKRQQLRRLRLRLRLQLHQLPRLQLRLQPPALADHTYPRLLHGAFS